MRLHRCRIGDGSVTVPINFVDIEMYADREEDLQALFAELAEEDEELPPVIQDEGLGEAWEWAA